MKSLKHLLARILIDSPAEMVMKRFNLSMAEYMDAKKEYFRLTEAKDMDAWSGKTQLQVGVMDDGDMLFMYVEGENLDVTIAVTKEVQPVKIQSVKVQSEPTKELVKVASTLYVESDAENIGIELTIPSKDGVYSVEVTSEIKIPAVVAEIKQGRISFILPKKAIQRKPGRKKKTSEETTIRTEAGQTSCDAPSNETGVGIKD